MKPIFFGSLAGIAACSTIPSVFADSAQQQAQRPNVLVIYTDDMGVGDLSFTGSAWARTPHIDRLARQGLIIDQYYSAAPVSSASRTGITTGQFPLQWGINSFLATRAKNRAMEQYDYLDPQAPSMARTFQQNGYVTGHFGKWHMGGGRDVTDAPSIAAYGFDECKSTYESPDPDPRITAGNWIWQKEDEIKRWQRTAYFVDLTLDFLARHKGEPCFVNLWPDDVHTPWVYGREAMGGGKRKNWEIRPYLEKVLIEYDRQIGRLLDGLAELGLAENTIVIFTSDNGPAPSFGQIRTNGLRGQKNSLYEGGIRMPFILRWPAVVGAGQRDSTSVVTALDLFPSLCSLAGIPLPEGYRPGGEDMRDALLGHGQKRTKDMMWDFGRNNAFSKPKGNNHSPHLAIRHGDWKLLMNADGSRMELYNLREDVNETHNLATEHSTRVRQLKRRLLKWWKTRNGPVAE